jgi:hypothetical protein
VHVVFDSHFFINKRAPVYLDGNKIGEIDKQIELRDKKVITIKLPDSLFIPIDSRFLLGHLDTFGNTGIEIRTSNSTQHLSKNDTVMGYWTDDYVGQFDYQATDSAFTQEVIKKMKEAYENVSSKDSTKKE